MKYQYDGSVAALEFDSDAEYKEWILERLRRAGDRFSGEVEKVGDIGPISASRLVVDDVALLPDTLETLEEKFGDDVVAVRVPLDRAFSILQVEVLDPETGAVHLFDVGVRADFDSVDRRRPSKLPNRARRKLDSAEAIAEFGVAYGALGRSAKFSISAVTPAQLKARRKSFAGFCPRCDGLLERTGLKVDEEDNGTVLWEERCVDCDQRDLGWRKGDGKLPHGRRVAARPARTATPTRATSRPPARKWYELWK